jgi:hypothetical protein
MLLVVEFVEAYGGPISTLGSATVGAGVIVWQVKVRMHLYRKKRLEE